MLNVDYQLTSIHMIVHLILINIKTAYKEPSPF